MVGVLEGGEGFFRVRRMVGFLMTGRVGVVGEEVDGVSFVLD